MPLLIRTPVDMFKEVEKRLHYKWWDKGRERSNRAAGMRAAGPAAYQCLLRHDQIAYSGPPHDKVRAYVCLRCHGAACEDEIKHEGWEFDTIPWEEIHRIMDKDLDRQNQGNPKTFSFYR